MGNAVMERINDFCFFDAIEVTGREICWQVGTWNCVRLMIKDLEEGLKEEFPMEICTRGVESYAVQR